MPTILVYIPLQKYEELDDQVQTAFDAYLVERGIDADFGEYLMKLAADKEQRECALEIWLLVCDVSSPNAMSC